MTESGSRVACGEGLLLGRDGRIGVFGRFPPGNFEIDEGAGMDVRLPDHVIACRIVGCFAVVRKRCFPDFQAGAVFENDRVARPDAEMSVPELAVRGTAACHVGMEGNPRMGIGAIIQPRDRWVPAALRNLGACGCEQGQ